MLSINKIFEYTVLETVSTCFRQFSKKKKKIVVIIPYSSNNSKYFILFVLSFQI